MITKTPVLTFFNHRCEHIIQMVASMKGPGKVLGSKVNPSKKCSVLTRLRPCEIKARKKKWHIKSHANVPTWAHNYATSETELWKLAVFLTASKYSSSLLLKLNENSLSKYSKRFILSTFAFVTHMSVAQPQHLDRHIGSGRFFV